MKIVFAGTPDFAVAALDALAAAGHDIAAAYTQPDRPAGRGRHLQSTPVARRAEALGLPVRKPARLTPDEVAALRTLAPDAMVVVAYGLILSAAVLEVPRLGCFNIHASLLPRWRGAAPIARAVLAGDAESGVTIMRMDAGLDTGPMLLRESVAIAPAMTAGELHDALAPLGARLIVRALDELTRGALHETPQPAAGATYAKKIAKDEARLDWALPADELARRVGGYNPAPMAWCELDGERVRLLRARAGGATPGATPGTIVAVNAGGIHVATGNGVLVVTELQFAGGTPQTAQQAGTGRSLAGQRLA